MIEILCHVDRMYVRVRRELFKTRDAYKYLKLGGCPVNRATTEHYYFLYLLKTDCGFKKECIFPRFFRSYQVGFHPKLQGGTVFKALQPKGSYTLTPQDEIRRSSTLFVHVNSFSNDFFPTASGNEITGDKTYTLGQPMYFEAKRPTGTTRSGDQRMFVNKCFMTASSNPNSSPKYTVIDNHGCMIDSKLTEQSKFLTGDSKMAQKFSVGALIFKDSVSSSSSTQQLYMHCELYVGTVAPTKSSKACNYVASTKKWKELYGDDSVCTCCDSSCSSASSKASRNIISSHSWKVDLSRTDGDLDFVPQMKMDGDSLNLEDSNMAEHKEFLNYWEHDY
ncbi:zona pellucida sperm-binding protein 3 [Tautogolabrus adspersus]